MTDWFGFPLFIDAALLIIFFVTLIVTFKKGFLRSILGLIAWYVSFAVALAACAPAAAFVYERFMRDEIVTEITENLPDLRGSENPATFTDAALNELPESVLGISEAIGLDIEDIASGFSPEGLAFESIADELEQKVISPIAISVCRVVVFGVIFLVLLLILRTAAFFLNGVVKLPLLRPLNKLLGLLLGIVKGAAALAFLALAFNIFAGMFEGSAWSNAVSGSKVVGFFNEVYAVLKLYK